jgi:acyl-CoA-binding protein
MVTKTPAFEKAVEDSRKLKVKPTQDELLEVGTRLKHMMSSFFVRWQISIGG